MSDLSDRLAQLQPIHREALLWFWDRRGEEIPWPGQTADGLFLANKAKGIHKPKGWRHVLSVRENLGSPYADREPIERSDGSWTYDYYQEGDELARRETDFTNRALETCAQEGVPIAVLRQTRPSPNSRYKVLGLATVSGWTSGYFSLEGFAASGALYVVTTAVAGDDHDDTSAPMNLEDARRRISVSIALRQGGGAFRAGLIRAFGGRCAITDCDVVDALEAAHIVPYRGPQTDDLANGLLLRADLHTLFDRELIDIEPLSLRVVLSPALKRTAYGELEGRPLRIPQGVKMGDLCKMLQTRRAMLSGV